MTKNEIMGLVSRSLFADLGYLDEDGRPAIRRVFCTWHKGLGHHLISTNASSSHVQCLLGKGDACLYFADNDTFEGVCFSGNASVRFEREWKRLLWHPEDVKYYPGVIDDPDYCVIEYTADRGRYYRFDGKGNLSNDEIKAFDLGKQYEDEYARTHPGN